MITLQRQLCAEELYKNIIILAQFFLQQLRRVSARDVQQVAYEFVI